MNLKITLTITIAFVMSFSILYLFNYYHIQEYEVKTIHEFYSQNFDSSKKSIVFLGSSHVGRLNATYIEDYLSKNGNDYNVYNLADAGKRPEKQIEQLKKTLLLNPELIVLGIGIFDFENRQGLHQNQNIDSSESIIYYFKQLVRSNGEILNILSNPKLHTLQFINLVSGENPIPFDRNTPFYVTREGVGNIIHDNDQLKKDLENNPYRGINEEGRIRNLAALEKIILFYKENNIDIVLFITPLSRPFLNSISEEENKITIGEVEKISQQLEITQFSFLHKYENLTIFSNPTHVTQHPDGLIYSQDIAKIIIQELNP